MKARNLLTTAMLAAYAAAGMAQQKVVNYNMTVSDGMTEERVSQTLFQVSSQLPPFSVASAMGEAMRFDGYSNFVKATLPSTVSSSTFTFSMVLAAETYPMMNTAEAETTPSYATIAGNLDETAKSGFALQLSSQGNLRFRFASAYANGYIFTIDSSEKLSCGKWHVVTAVLDKDANAAILYLDGESVGTCRMSRSDVRHSSADFYIGKDAADLKSGMFLINTFCGLIDDIAIYNEALQPSAIPSVDLQQKPDFNYPTSRYAESLWRPQFHGMPSGGWTNECHGMTYSDGRYHVFFQKNANGPYMARLHWGHISSENLISWREEPIAISPSESYDIKGCWSGCVYEKDGIANVLYTAVDNAKAVIAHAIPTDATLNSWEKSGIVVNGRPQGLSDDFRDPYHFTANNEEYIIVGSGKNGIGCCTLHQLKNGTWTNDGTIFFAGTNATLHGTFWEMPNLTDMGNGKWLFTCTPLGLPSGVKTIYWVGTIGSDGRFTPEHEAPKTLEINGIGKEGYGLLSPTIYQKDGKTLLLGIVPDKLPTETNYKMGWAHNYSLPREISLDGDGNLIQKPYSGLTAMRSTTAYDKQLTLEGSENLNPVSGRQIELNGEFTVARGRFGFKFLKYGNSEASLYYDPQNRTLSFDCSALEREANDNGVYDGKYVADLSALGIAEGSVLKLQVFVDGSIADVFVADRWAFSVRLFPTNKDGLGVEAFAETATTAKIKAWTLDAENAGTSGVESTFEDEAAFPQSSSVYDLQGRQLNGKPSKGIYITRGVKHYAR